MGIINNIKLFFLSRINRMLRYVLTVIVFVDVRSPFFKPTATVYLIWFRRKKVEAKSFKVPMDEDYRVDVDYILDKAPAHVLSIRYPHDWHDTLDELRADKAQKEPET